MNSAPSTSSVARDQGSATCRGGDSGVRRATPKVSIGLAVYNGEQYLAEALESILAQTFRDFELVICDNNSTDSTPEICARYAAKDTRIRYYRNPINIGGVRNENRSMFLARGSYFKLAAHDDNIAPRFLEECVAVLDANPDVEVCSTGAYFIDAGSNITETRTPRAGTEDRLHHRIRSIARFDDACEATYGLMRMRALKEVRPQTNHLHSDRIVLTELALRRPFHLIEIPLFYKRIHEGNAYRDLRGRMAWFQPELTLTGRIRLPHWQQAADYLTMLSRSRIDPLERLRCGAEVLRCIWRMRRYLAIDVVDGVRMFLRGKGGRCRRYMDESRWR